MATYCVTFRIADKTVNGKTYAERREMLVENARAYDGGYWEETTSFLLVESNKNTPDFGASVAKGLSEKDDLVVVFDPADMSAAYFGPLANRDVLISFFRVSKKVP